MISQRPNYITKLASITSRTPYLIIFFVLLVVFNILMNAPDLPFSAAQLEQVSGGYGPLDVTFGYSNAYVGQAIAAYGEVGKAIYARYQLLDVFFPAIYALFLGGLLFRLFGKRRGILALAYYLPFLGATLDYIENALLFGLVRAYPNVPAALVSVASTITTIKFIFPLLAVVSLLAGAVLWLRTRLQPTGARQL